MVKGTNLINTEQFNKWFNKSFTNFCEKSPLQFENSISSTGKVVMKISSIKDPITYQIDYTLVPDDSRQCVKRNIRNIKELILPYYPMLYDFVPKTYSDEEKVARVNKMMKEEGIHFDQALDIVLSNLIGQEDSVLRYRIMKTIMESNEINVYDMKEKKLKIYSLRIPLYIFMQEVYDDIMSASKLFAEKATFIPFENK